MQDTGKKIGIMGGAFDPIHLGHLLIAENAAAQYGLTQVLFMPSGRSPQKAKQEITEASHRCKMIELAIRDNPKFSLSTLEIEAAETNYTYKTLERLKELLPEDELFFILGGDCLKDFDRWRYPERILKAATVLAAVRDTVEGSAFLSQIAVLKKQFHTEGIYPLNTPNYEVSSSGIRSRVAEGRTIRYMVPEPVREYILTHQLYVQ